MRTGNPKDHSFTLNFLVDNRPLADGRDAYGKVWTIGYGTTRYENGQPVKKGDRISPARGLGILRNDVNKRAGAVNSLLGGATVNQNQFDALMSFAYNLGTGALGSSTLLAKVKRNRNDPSIRNEFARFVNAGGQRLPGLVRRRTAEANLYFS